ncbi:MAG TPA: peptidoglycan-binding domain-containing protein, partial [Haliangium sp.]|nr:peptidoglycan-binding domain-containing protein [Haliangium sp.]
MAEAASRQASRPLDVDASTIEWAQWILVRAEGEKLAADGIIGKQTRAALVRFQRLQGLAQSGDIDRATHTALLQTALEWLQQAELFASKGALDDHTSEELQRYQRRAGLDADGVFGPRTRAAMLGSLRAGEPLDREPEEVPAATATTVAATAATTATATTAVAATAVTGTATLQVPAGFRTDARKRGLIRYSGDRLDRALDRLRKQRLVELSDEDLDTFQRIANIETSGGTQGINTWDSAVVSIGFMQWTLEHGKVQKWIAAAPDAFTRHGISLDPQLAYRWGKQTQIGIHGVSDMEVLRWGSWAERFFQAGLDEQVLAVEVGLARSYLGWHLDGLRSRLTRLGVTAESQAVFTRHYRASLAIRGMFQAAYNNLPAAATDAVHRALLASQPGDETSTFESHLVDGIRASFS